MRLDGGPWQQAKNCSWLPKSGLGSRLQGEARRLPITAKIGSLMDNNAELARVGVKLGFVRAIDKAQESIVVAALARFFSDGHVHLPHQCCQDLPFSCQKQETTNISMHFSSTAGICSMSLSSEFQSPILSWSITYMVWKRLLKATGSQST